MVEYSTSKFKENPPEDENPSTWFLASEYRYLQVATTTKASTLALNQRLVWSWLVYKLRDEKAVTGVDCARGTGLEQETCSRCLKQLTTLGLAQKVKGGYLASQPTGDQLGWFVWHDLSNRPWQDAIGKYKVLRRSANCPLTSTQNALYFLMVSLANGRTKIVQTYKGLAIMLGGVRRETVTEAFKVLINAGLIVEDESWWRLVRPMPETLRHWQRKDDPEPAAQPTPKNDEKPKSKSNDKPRTTNTPKPKTTEKDVEKDLYELVDKIRWTGPADSGLPIKDDYDIDIIRKWITGTLGDLRNRGYSASAAKDCLTAALDVRPLHSSTNTLVTWLLSSWSRFVTEAEEQHTGNTPSNNLLLWKLQKFQAERNDLFGFVA